MGLKQQTERIRQQLLDLSRGHKRAITMFADMMVLPLAVWFAFFLRLGEPFHLFFMIHWWLVLAIPPIGIACFAVSGLYNMVARYIGPRAIYDVFRAAALTTLAFVAVVEILRLEPFPRSVYAIFLGVVFLLNGGMRLLARSWFQSFLSKPRGRQPVAIYGAGRAGAVGRLVRDDADRVTVVGYGDGASVDAFVLEGKVTVSMDRTTEQIEYGEYLRKRGHIGLATGGDN